MSYSRSFLFGLCLLFLLLQVELCLGRDAAFEGRVAGFQGQAAEQANEVDKTSDEPETQNSWLIQGALIHTLTGEGDFVGDILVRSGKIAAVSEEIRLHQPLPIINASGMHAVPGFCEAQTFFLLDRGKSPSSQIQADVLDAFDYFDEETMERALSRGLTSLCLAPAAQAGFSGRAAVVKLLPGRGLDTMILQKDVALKAGMGSPGPGRTLARIKSVKGLSKKLQAALDYQEVWEEYKEELDAYLKELEKDLPEEPPVKEDGTPEIEKSPETDDPGDEPVPNRDKEVEEKETGLKPLGAACKDLSSTYPNGNIHLGAESGARLERVRTPEEREKQKQKPERKAQDNTKSDAAKPDEKEELKKPRKPAYDISKELLAKALDGEMAIHLEVHRAADILAALELGRRFTVDFVLVGCTEGHLVIDALHEAGVPVIVGQTEQPEKDVKNGFHNRIPDLAACLQARGIPFALSSTGGGDNAAQYLAMNAAQAAGHGLSAQAALEAITLKPAEILGVSDRIGSLAKGKDADIVLFNNSPLDSDARVEHVLINGIEVYKSKEKPGDD